MPITVTWGNSEKTYTIFAFRGKWTWEEYYQSIADGVKLIAEVPHKVNILIDMREATLLPNNLLSHTNSSMRQPPREFDLAVIVTESAFVQIMGNTLDRFFSKKTRFKVVKKIEDAHELLRIFDAETAAAANGTVKAKPATFSRKR